MEHRIAYICSQCDSSDVELYYRQQGGAGKRCLRCGHQKEAPRRLTDTTAGDPAFWANINPKSSF